MSLIFIVFWSILASSTSQFTMNSRLGWFLFECPNLVWVAICYQKRNEENSFIDSSSAILLSIFTIHYINRSIIYPLRISRHAKPLPIHVFLAAFFSAVSTDSTYLSHLFMNLIWILCVYPLSFYSCVRLGVVVWITV